MEDGQGEIYHTRQLRNILQILPKADSEYRFAIT